MVDIMNGDGGAGGTIALRSLLERQKLLEAVPPEGVDLLVTGGRQQSFAVGEVLLRQGDLSDSAVLILDGELVVSVETAYGDVPLNIVTGPVLLGEIGVLAELPRTATIRARSAGQALWIDRDLFTRIGHDNPSILRQIVGALGGRIASFNQALGFYTNALAALERDDFEPGLLDELRNPPPELLAFAVTFRKMADQIIQRRARLTEMASASAIQRAMLPDPLPADAAGRFELHAAMRPAKEVGGDFYDAFLVTPDRLAVTIGDVSGKGVPASLFMAVCQTVMRLLLREEANLGRAVTRANDMLDANNREVMFATFFGATLDLVTGELRYSNCGHNPPVLVRLDGACERLAASDPPLAVMSPVEYGVHSVRLAPGDRILLYTDGVTEAHDPDDRLFGEERLQALAEAGQSVSGQRLIEQVFAAVADFSAGRPQFDDIACVALTFTGAPRAEGAP